MEKVKIAAGMAFVDYGNVGALVKEATEAGVDCIHADACDMYEMPQGQLMGGHQVIAGIRPYTNLPIECHAYLRSCDVHFVKNIAEAGANMLILPAEHHIGAPLAYIMHYCQEFGLKFGLTIGCFTPLCFVEESIYELDRLHIVVHGVRDKNWSWRRSALDLVRRAGKLIEEKNPDCELAVDGGINYETVHELVEAGANVVIGSRPIFKNPDGIRTGVQMLREGIERAKRGG